MRHGTAIDTTARVTRASTAYQQLLGRVAESLSSCLVLTDASKPGNPIVYVNAAFTELTGYACRDAIGRDLWFLEGPETDAAIMGELRGAVSAGVAIRREALNYRRDGHVFWNDVAVDPIRSGRGRLLGFAVTMHDSSEQHAARAEHLATLERLTNITSNAPGYIFQRILRRDGSIAYSYLSPSLFRILGLPEDTDWTAGQNFAWFQPGDREDFLSLTRQSAAAMTRLRCDIRVMSAAGKEHWFRTDSLPRRMLNGEILWEGLALDITAEKVAQAELDFVANHDALTGLSNRLFFRSAVIEALSPGADKIRRTTMFYIDLCGFEGFNDLWGEAFADKALRRIASKLTDLAETMAGTVSRLGGDEFGLLLPDMPPETDAAQVGRFVCAEIGRPMTIDGVGIVIEACVGAAESTPSLNAASPGAEERATELMKRVHLAVSTAKLQGPGVCVLYSSDLDDRVANRAVLRNSLQHAIEQEQFELHYQPLVELSTGTIIGAEALVRWRHPELGLVRPDLFIPLAESTRLIVPLGGWITRTAMRQAKYWRRRGIEVPRISINLSSIQLQHAGLIDMVETALDETGSAPADFEFELTEGILIDISPEVNARLATLKQLGFTLALDDFGTGHATFAYLRQFPVDKIKIDQTFVQHLVIGSSDALIVKAMITMARSLGLEVLAEGVETRRQRDFLIEEGCKSGQGYLFSRPLEAADFAGILQQGATLP